jgi:uncharacterized protein YaaR (DUF327 family)
MLESELKKLILAKGIFLHGCSHVNAKDKVSIVLSIHHFDFAVEMVLKCVAVKHNVVSSAKQEFKFKDLWNEITQRSIDLPLKSRMFELHDLRNLIQHAGVTPSLEEVMNFKEYVETFLEQVIEKEFETSFDGLSLAQLIQNAELRQILQKANRLFKEGEYKECILASDEALIKASFEVTDIFGKAGILTGYFGAGDELKIIISKDYAEKYKDKEFYILAKDLSKTILQWGQASTGMQFLNGLRGKFLEFRELISNLDVVPKEELREKACFSLDFVIELILKWQEEGIMGLF